MLSGIIYLFSPFPIFRVSGSFIFMHFSEIPVLFENSEAMNMVSDLSLHCLQMSLKWDA